MTVIDASALLAILQGEPERESLLDRIGADPAPVVSPVNLLEAHMLMRSRRGEVGVAKLDEFVVVAGIKVAAIDAAQAAAAREAFDRFGKGRHPASLNLADCFAYALSKTLGEPLLFKGRDFEATDVTAAE